MSCFICLEKDRFVVLVQSMAECLFAVVVQVIEGQVVKER